MVVPTVIPINGGWWPAMSRSMLSPNPPILDGALAPRHTISRPGFCAPHSRSDGCAHSGARRRTTIWRTWTPIRSPRIGGSGLGRGSAGRRPTLREDLRGLDGGGRSGGLATDPQLRVDVGEVP